MKTKKLSPLSPAEYWIDLAELEQNFEKKKYELEERLSLFRDKCKHKNTHYHSDPSGGRDGCHECVDCGKEI